MKISSIYPFFITIVILCSISCSNNVTSVRFVKTINLLESITPSVGAMSGRKISGFKLGDFSTERDLISNSTTGPIQFDLPAAGHETPPCNDGIPLRRAGVPPMIRILSLIGDTGGDDVSDDDDCHCDAHIQFIEFIPIEVVFDDGGNLRIPSGRIEGKRLLCPNTVENHHISGDRDFDGSVVATFNLTLRIADSGEGFYADVRYDLREVD